MADIDDAESRGRQLPRSARTAAPPRRARAPRSARRGAGCGHRARSPWRSRPSAGPIPAPRQAVCRTSSAMPSSASSASASRLEPRPIDQPEPRRRTAGENVLGDADRAGQRQLLEDRRDAERLRVPRRADRRPARPPLGCSPASGCDHAGEDVHQRRLAGAVLADQRVHLARRELERHVVERQRRAEALADPRDGKRERHRLAQVPVRRSAGLSAAAMSVTPAE